MARHAVLKEPKVYLLVTLGVPVLFHGTMDFYAFFAAAEARSAPILGLLATPLDIVLVFFLLLLCRRYGNMPCYSILSVHDVDDSASCLTSFIFIDLLCSCAVWQIRNYRQVMELENGKDSRTSPCATDLSTISQVTS
jgi:hypothetical protein